ncbi:DNA primase family protein [Pseudoxanthomonas winnipegensis]|uniref:SF3 helicase domain-containing protein n=1 Tax=Pseudoxanthomonas winnipegensis TaxID=2480810 RepID=A0A4Q8M396_9GAMM|nr:phage/plasmid primase, P4 family [Pseudoxanthomonas winnipegensis]TAA41581.1 hypothetical protein EA655_11615 [Pseudoxanthomonas winnipegensis]
MNSFDTFNLAEDFDKSSADDVRVVPSAALKRARQRAANKPAVTTHFNPQGKKAGKTNKPNAQASAAPAEKKPTAQAVFVNSIQKGTTVYAGRKGCVYKWDGIAWRLIDLETGTGIANDFILKAMPGNYSFKTAQDAWKAATSILTHTSTLPERTTQVVIPVLNGYVHVEPTGQILFKKADKALGMTFNVKATVNALHGAMYTPKPVPDDSLFGRFLKSSMEDPDMRALIQEQCALSLIPGIHQLAFWWYGSGENGKGTMMSILRGFHEVAANVNLHKLDDDTEKAAVVGASILITSEVADGKWAENSWKELMGGDLIKAKQLYKDPISFVNQSTHYIASNGLPFITDPSNGVYRRLCIVEWTNQAGIKRIDELPKKILEKEAHIVLDWLLEGVQRITKRDGKFMPKEQWPLAVKQTNSAVRNGNDTILTWAEDTGACSDASVLTAKELVYFKYEQWCKDEGVEVVPNNIFWKRIWRLARFSATAPKTASSEKTKFKGNSRAPAVRIKVRLTTEEQLDEAGVAK